MSGKWDAPTIASLAAIAKEHGWQTFYIPDARVLNILGLGASTAGISAPEYPPNYRNRAEEDLLRYEEEK
jgi:hypothetical protein